MSFRGDLWLCVIVAFLLTGCGTTNEEGPCFANPCQNGGVCSDTEPGYSCSCPEGFSGDSCETNIDECDPNPCQNGGDCNDGVASYSCDCVDGFSGDNCETDIDDCADAECVNGSCVDGVAAYSCTCDPGWSGELCDVDVDECTDDSICNDNATCTNLPGSYQCDCNCGYALAGDSEDCTPVTDCDAGQWVSVQDGAWDDAATWGGGDIPGNCAEVEIAHAVTAASCTLSGSSPASYSPTAVTSPALKVTVDGSLLLSEGATLVSRGDVHLLGLMTMAEGSTLELDASQATDPTNTEYRLLIESTWNIYDTAKLVINGTENQRCALRSNPDGGPGRILAAYDTGIFDPDVGSKSGGRIIAAFTDFSGFGSAEKTAWHFRADVSTAEVRVTDSTFTDFGEIVQNYTSVAGASVIFERNIWTASIPSIEKESIFRPSSAQDATMSIKNNSFDARVYLYGTVGAVIEDNVFGDGLQTHPNLSGGGQWASFRHNLIRQPKEGESGFGMRYGQEFLDNVYIMDYDGWNPHFLAVQHGTGETLVSGNVFWFTGPQEPPPGAEGDGVRPGTPDSGTYTDNHIIVEENIFLPNGNGPDGLNNLSATVLTILIEDANKRVSVHRNTAFTNGSGGCAIGETGVTAAGNLFAVKSNLFVGDINNTGYKIHNLNYAEEDAVLAQDADYNGCWRCFDGDNFMSGAGKGYDGLSFSGSQLIGANDIDDVDPQFVDWNRTPATWDGSLGGSGTLDGAAERLMPGGGNSVEELLAYIREGFRPQNPLLKGAGDPASGSPDLGAVDMN
jgi:hypothetical protein